LRDNKLIGGIKKKINIPTPNTPKINKYKINLNKINSFLLKHCIALDLEDISLNTIAHIHKRQEDKQSINFSNVSLRRIFSRGSMLLGGRFYGGWWQFIPSDYRKYITINGLATVEIDFSELHPRLLYLSQNLAPPTGDLYDIGLRHEGVPYDAKVEPYASQRKIIKEVFNALLNDETGNYRLSTSKIKQMGGLTFGQLKKLLLKRHPPLQAVLKKGVGLSFQYQDSQIAEKVMLALLAQNITCLPVHDSFIVPRHQGRELILAMRAAFSSVLPGFAAKLKDPTDYATDFRLIFDGDKVDMQAVFAMFEAAHHETFVKSRHAAMGR
jgi:hypothetical protein